MFSRRAASEFPNDNPELHDGLVWQSDSVTGHALPTLRLRQLTGTMPKVLRPAWDERAKRVVTAPRAEAPVARTAPERVAAGAPNLEPPEVLGSEPVADAGIRASVAEPEPPAASVAEPEPPAAPLAEMQLFVTCTAESEPPVELERVAPDADVPSVELPPPPTPFDALMAALVRVVLDRGATRLAAELPALLTGGRTTPGLVDSPRAKSLIALGPAWRAALEGGDLAGCGDQPLDVWSSELLATLLTAPGEREALRRALRGHGVAAFGMLIAA